MKHIKEIKLSAFLDGELSKEERREIAVHLKSCAQCRKELENLSIGSDSLDLIEDVQVPPYFRLHLKDRIAERESKRLFRKPFAEWAARVAIPIGAAAFIIFSLFLGSHLGKMIYQEGAETVASLDVEYSKLLGIPSLDELPEGSLGWTYNNVLTGGNND